MRKRYRLLAVACGALLAIALALLLTREREPLYEGKGLSYWEERWSESQIGSASALQAEEAIVALATNRIELLAHRVCYDPERDILLKAFHLLPAPLRLRMNLRFVHRRMTQCDEAQWALRVLGPGAAPAIPQLTKALDSGGTVASGRALGVLAALGDEGLSVIASRALTNNPKRLSMIRAFTLHTNFPPAFIVLTNALSDPDPAVRTEANDILTGRVFE